MPFGREMVALTLLAVAAPIGLAEHPIPESERWATITHAGNEPYKFLVGNTSVTVGRVDYEYQISRTEVTGSEWFEFVQAYAPFINPADRDRTEFTSLAIEQVGPVSYHLAPTMADRAIEIGWRYAARYCNWLHNDKALTAEAFESGAYDTSTFGFIEGYGYTDQKAHAAGARYWIPTRDEWTKAMHFDPDRHDEGQPGYWLYPHSSDDVPIGGPPDQGGQTSAGYVWTIATPLVAGYRDVMSPWGLWDGSGGASEWLETTIEFGGTEGNFERFIKGTDLGDDDFWVETLDRVDGVWLGINGSLVGLRIAREVPSPGGVAPLGLMILMFVRPRRSNRVDRDSRRERRVCSRVPFPSARS